MTQKPTDSDRSTAPYAAALWIYTAVVAIATGVAFGNIFQTEADYVFSAHSSFNVGAFIGGLALGAFSTIPFWALYALGAHLLSNVIKLRDSLANAQGATQGTLDKLVENARQQSTPPPASAAPPAL